jgi:uncharacterized SAM-binding protein YcdF (DUF218 family)
VIVIGSSLWFVGLILFTRLIPSLPLDTTSSTEGIVIFTGGETRLKVALNLFEQQKGKYLLISGVNPDSNLSKLVAQMPFKSQITLGYDALDTTGNAEETEAWVKKNRIETLRLITSNYHMPRSLFELRHLLPHVHILPHPVVGERFLKDRWWTDASALRVVVHEYNKFLFSLIRRSFEDLQDSITSQVKM